MRAKINFDIRIELMLAIKLNRYIVSTGRPFRNMDKTSLHIRLIKNIQSSDFYILMMTIPQLQRDNNMNQLFWDILNMMVSQLIFLQLDMWNLEIRSQLNQIQLPLVTVESIVRLVTGLLGFRIVISYVLEKKMHVITKKEHTTKSLQFSYFYHLAIIILGLNELNWNMFDLQVWVITYGCLGMVRKTIYIIGIQRNLLLNDYSYNNQIIPLLVHSKFISYILFPASICYIFWANFVFIGVLFKAISLLCFPSIMLAIDSLFLFLTSKATEKHLNYYYNQNINEVPPTYKLQLYHNIAGSAVRAWHFYNLTMISIKTAFDKIDFLDCLWVFSVLSSLYSSLSTCVSSGIKYNNMKKLSKSINQIFKKVKSRSDQICIICMQPLLNCHQLVNCGHIFHYKCFFQWVQTKEECPVCRVRINLNV